MAHLNQAQYDRRRENAAARNVNNEAIAVDNGMTQEQAEAISHLCSLRHELHTNMDSIVKNDNQGVKKSLVDINAVIEESGLSSMSFIPASDDDYIDIDTIDEMYEWDDVPVSGTDEWQEWYDENYSRIYGELEALNKNIENYLAEVDEKYHTSFCPTGALRVF